MQNRIQEIKSFIEHEDYSLAVRRMLDICLDVDDAQLLHQAILWSKHFHHHLKKATIVDETFHQEAYRLLVALNKYNNHSINNPETLINVDAISKTYTKGNFSLKPISIAIQTTNVIGVVGENGNGKTTFLRCLAGQLSIDGGTIDYSLLSNPDYYTIKHSIAFIPQRIPKWYGLLKDNLHFSASLSGVTGKQNELMVDYMLERLNLSDYAHLNWNQISSGYRTRFEIARILLQKPNLLILDEPLANLDINAQQTILTDLRYIAKSAYHPMGVILSSQQLHEVEKVADTVLFIKNGNCLFKTGEATTITKTGFAIEIETSATREELAKVLGEDEVQIQFNGGNYTITSATLTANNIIAKLVTNNISLNYFRDITHSTKRYF